MQRAAEVLTKIIAVIVVVIEKLLVFSFVLMLAICDFEMQDVHNVLRQLSKDFVDWTPCTVCLFH